MRRIAALTARNTNSDVRVAIKTLYYSAVEPGLGVEQNFERARKDLFLDVIKDLNEKNLFILKAAAEEKEKHVKRVYEKYRRLSERYREEPFSYVYFYANLAYLQSLGLILLISTKANRSYTNRIELVFDAELLETIWEMRFGRAEGTGFEKPGDSGQVRPVFGAVTHELRSHGDHENGP